MASRILALLLSAFALCNCDASPKQTTVEVLIANETFTLELSTDTPSRVHGLMERTALRKDGGMLFVFTDAAERSFWMANCFINIDLIFLDSRGTITATHEMKTETPRGEEESQWEYEGRLKKYYSHGPARFAIELCEGSIRRLNLKPNEHIPLNLQQLRRIAR